MNRLLNDLRYGVRMLLKTPTATGTVLIALSLGIGLSALTFSLINGAVLTSLPTEGGDRIMRIGRVERLAVTGDDYPTWSARQRSFDELGAVEMSTVTLSVEGTGAEPVRSASITPSILAVLAAEPLLGRPFTEEDAAPGAAAVVLVSHDVWRDRLASDPSVLGRIVRVNGRPAQVIGVMPAGFGFPWDQQVWSPLDLDPISRGGTAFVPVGESAWIVGRLRGGVSPRAAARELTVITSELDRERRGAAGPESTVSVVNYTDLFSQSGQSVALAALMLGIAFLVLLVACSNVANVLLARTVARRRELAIRLAIGASRIRITAQLLSEISLLAAAGAAGGIGIGLIGARFIEAAMPPGMPYWIEVRMDLPVLAFVAIVAVIAALLAGLMPAIQASRSNTHDLLKDDSRGSSSFRMGRVMRRLIGVEMALSFVLLLLAGLFIRSAANFQATEFAFQPEEVYTARIGLPERVNGDAASRVRLSEQLSEALASLPQVANVALATAVPGVGSAAAIAVETDGAAAADSDGVPRARTVVVTPGFFDLFGASPIVGRDFDAIDGEGTLRVAIVNDAFASVHFPAGALDRRIRFSGADGVEEWLTIVGVTPDLMAGGIEGEVPEAVYLPLTQNPRPTLQIVARPHADFASLPTPIREAVGAVDPDIALFDVRPLVQVISMANSQYTWLSLLFLVSGGVALFLAALGLYGVMAFWVIQRTREIGVRMAVGGQRRDIVWLVMRQGMAQISIGLVAGVILAVPAARLLGSALFGVAPYDPLVFGTILAVLIAAASLGCWLPARRATRIDPLQALAAE